MEALGVGWGGCPPPCLALSFPARGTEKLYYLTSMGPPSGLNLRFITIWGNKVILADRTHSDLPAPGGVVPSSFPHLTPQSQLALRQVRAPGGGGGGVLWLLSVGWGAVVRLASKPVRQPPMQGLPLTSHLVQVSLLCLSWGTQPTSLVNWNEISTALFPRYLLRQGTGPGFGTHHRDLGRMMRNPSRGALELGERASSRRIPGRQRSFQRMVKGLQVDETHWILRCALSPFRRGWRELPGTLPSKPDMFH